MRKVLLFLAWLIPALCLAQGVDYPTDRSADNALNLAIHQSGPTADFDPDSPLELEPDRHFTMDDSAASTVVLDKSGNANGTASANTADFDAAAGSCKVGTCLDFNGTDHAIDGGSDFISTGADSMLAWVYVDGGHENGFGHIFNNGKTYFILRNNGALYCTRSGGVTQYVSAVGGVAGSAWVHVACTSDAAGVTNVYVNGVISGTANQSGGSPAGGTGNVFIGNNATGTATFNGKIDDVRHYSRVLTPNEIQAIYNAGSGHQRQDTGANRGAIVVDSSNRIGAWVDKVQRIEAAQSDDAKKPVFATLNGRRVLSFDGTDDYLLSGSTLASVFTSKLKTYIFTAQLDAIASDHYLMSSSDAQWSVYPSDNSHMRHNNYDGASKSADVTTTTILANVYSGQHNGTLANSRVPSGTAYVAVGANTATTGTLKIGANLNASSVFDGTIARLITYNKVLPTSVLLPIERGLARKYGVSLAGATAEQSCEAFFASKTPTLYLDSSDLSTITKDVNSKVSSWCSKIGSVCFTQATESAQPVWDGYGIYFNGVQRLTSTATEDDLFNNNAKTAFVVGKHKTIDANDYPRFMESTNARFSLYDYYGGGTDLRAYFTNNDGSVDNAYGAYTSITTPFIHEFTHDGTNITAQHNGGTAGSTASGNTAVMTDLMHIGRAAGSTATEFLDGWDLVILTDDSVWTADERARARSCLGEKYGVSF